MKKSVALGLALCLLFRSAGCGRASSGTAGAAAPAVVDPQPADQRRLKRRKHIRVRMRTGEQDVSGI